MSNLRWPATFDRLDSFRFLKDSLSMEKLKLFKLGKETGRDQSTIGNM